MINKQFIKSHNCEIPNNLPKGLTMKLKLKLKIKKIHINTRGKCNHQLNQ